jgi:hypothetical protein
MTASCLNDDGGPLSAWFVPGTAADPEIRQVHLPEDPANMPEIIREAMRHHVLALERHAAAHAEEHRS